MESRSTLWKNYSVLFKVKEKAVSLKTIPDGIKEKETWHLAPGYCSRTYCGTVSQGACRKIGELMCWNSGLAQVRCSVN